MSPARPWIDPHDKSRLTDAEALARMEKARVVLLGERHDCAQDHHWQARTLASLAARKAPVIVGFEMFPRSAQPVLDSWALGELSPRDFLDQVRWSEIWGFDPVLYQGLFDLCRDLGLQICALNIARPLVSAIGKDGWGAIPPDHRDWFTPARTARPAYRQYLFEITGGVRPGRTAQSPDDPAFDRFVRAQQAWDRAFACALAEALAQTPHALAVGIIGRGHLEYGLGVADQLDDLGIAPVITALPDVPPGSGAIADLVFDPDMTV